MSQTDTLESIEQIRKLTILEASVQEVHSFRLVTEEKKCSSYIGSFGH
jgi:hypothetical protein